MEPLQLLLSLARHLGGVSFCGCAPTAAARHLAEGGLRDVDIDRELNETSPVDDGEVPLEQPGPWSAAFPLFSAMPEAAFFPAVGSDKAHMSEA